MARCCVLASWEASIFAFYQECRFNSLTSVEFWNEIFQMRGGIPDNGVLVIRESRRGLLLEGVQFC